MQIIFELPDEEIQSIIKEKALSVAKGVISGWNLEQTIKSEITKQWQGAVADIVAEALFDLPAVREKVAVALERKILAQLTAAMAKAGK